MTTELTKEQLYRKEYYLKNKLRISEQIEEWHRKHHWELKAYYAAYREKNREKLNQGFRDRRAKLKEMKSTTE